MNRKPGINMAMLSAAALIGMIWFFAGDNAQDPPKEMNQAEACDSCSARHKNLTRLRDAIGSAARKDE